MAYNPVVGDNIRWTIYSQVGDQIAENVLHYTVVSLTAPGGTLDDYAQGIWTMLSENYRALISFRAKILGAKAELTVNPAGVMWGSYSINLDGSFTGDLLPRQVSGLISWRTDKMGGSFRGRTYIPWPGEGYNELAGKPTAAYLTALQTLANGAILLSTVPVGFVFADLQLVVWSTKLTEGNNVTVAVAKDVWAEQHRRGDFGRANIAPF